MIQLSPQQEALVENLSLEACIERYKVTGEDIYLLKYLRHYDAWIRDFAQIAIGRASIRMSYHWISFHTTLARRLNIKRYLKVLHYLELILREKMWDVEEDDVYQHIVMTLVDRAKRWRAHKNPQAGGKLRFTQVMKLYVPSELVTFCIDHMLQKYVYEIYEHQTVEPVDPDNMDFTFEPLINNAQLEGKLSKYERYLLFQLQTGQSFELLRKLDPDLTIRNVENKVYFALRRFYEEAEDAARHRCSVR